MPRLIVFLFLEKNDPPPTQHMIYTLGFVTGLAVAYGSIAIIATVLAYLPDDNE